jgi:hypothetical protein
MSGELPPADQHRPGVRSTIDIRALLTHREYIKTAAYLLPRHAKIRVLEMMERLRHDRRGRGTTPEEPPGPLPEMTSAEMVREINWRIGTLPPNDAEAVARYIRHLTRWQAARRGRRSGGPRPRPARGGPSVDAPA